MKPISIVIVVGALTGALTTLQAPVSASAGAPEAQSSPAVTLETAQRLFYSGRYAAAAELTSATCAPPADNLTACEVHTSALLFQIKRAIGSAEDKDSAWKLCAPCPDLMSAFVARIAHGQDAARERLRADPSDEANLFLLGKLDLNYVWLQLGTLGRKTGWNEYWEARRSLDQVLKQNPDHVRARVARAWIDYIVDTKMPRGTRWLLGGGNRKRGLLTLREAAGTDTDFFVQAEAGFALWDMQVRERNLAGAVITARGLARDFPENEDVSRFLETHDRSRLP